MITLVITKNPFEPWNGREIKKITAGETAGELLNYYSLQGVETLIAVNGNEVQPDYITKSGDFVVICPVIGKSGSGKQILALVASIALSVVAMGAGSALATTKVVAGVATKVWTLGSYLAAAAIMFVGNMLIGRMTAQAVDTGSYGGENSPTYSWGDVQTMVGQNNAIALTYGTVLSGGQSIGKYVNTLDNEEYLNWLIAAGEGQLEITDIKLNDNDISYFEGVDVELRSGTNTQEVISNFNDTFYTKPLDYQLTDTARTDTVPGNASQGIVAKLEFPGGLYYANDKGGLSGAWVKVLGQYRLGEDGDWIPFVYSKTTPNQYIKSVSNDAVIGTYRLQVYDEQRRDDTDPYEPTYITVTVCKITYPDGTVLQQDINRGQQFTLGYFTVLIRGNSSDDEPEPSIDENFTVSYAGAQISGSQSSALRKEYRIDNLPAGQYYVKMEVTARSAGLTDSRASVRCYWTALTSIVYDDFSYPNMALIGIKALATDQINGSPTLKFKKTKSIIYAWNPHTEAYEEKDAKNVAWACYDAVHLCRYLEHPNTHEWVYDVQGVNADRMLYDQFDEWAAFCEEKGLYVNIEINQLGEMLDIVNQKIAPIGHGKVLRFGTRYGCTWDCAKQPVQMFGMGNIVAGSFQEQFLPATDRANAVEITYMDADNDFNRETITVMADDYDTAVEVKTAQATYDGITSYEQAYREGKYQLFCNKYRLRTISFEADIDAISCTIGDVVLVAHDVPKWAHSGRVAKVKDDELLLPVELADITKSYRVMYRTINDNMYTTNCEVLENKDGWCKVKIDSYNAADPPQENDVFDIAEVNVGSKPFIIQNISRSKDFHRKIECIEYDERIYSEDYDIPAIEYHEEDTRPKNVTGLSATSYHYVTNDGVTRQHIDVSWNTASVGTYTISVLSNETWSVVDSGIKGNRYSADLDMDIEKVKVVTVSGVVSTSGTVADVVAIDTLVTALDILNLHTTFSVHNNGLRLTAEWDGIDASVLKTYVADFDGDEKRITDATVQYNNVSINSHTLKVKAQAVNGQYGRNATLTYSKQTDNSVAYSKFVPVGSISYATINKIGGKTIVWKQLRTDENSTLTSDGITTEYSTATNLFTITNNSRTTNYSSGSTRQNISLDSLIAGHKYIVVADSETDLTGIKIGYKNSSGTSIFKDLNTVFDIPNIQSGTKFFLRVFNTYDFVNVHPIGSVTAFTINIIDLTLIYGSGNEPASVADFKVMFPASYYAYNAGTLLSAEVTSVVSKDSNDITLQTYSIPASIQALTGYGQSCPSHYNYIDFEAKKFVKEVGSRAYTSGDESDNTVITDGTNTYYALTVSVETDISSYLTDNGIVEVEAGGTLSFLNSNGTGYLIPVPSEEAYMVAT